MSAPRAAFGKLHEIAKTSDAVMRLDYPCQCYQPGCAHERLMKLLGWWEAGGGREAVSAPKPSKHEFGKCGWRSCRRWAVVKIQDHARCLTHYEADMAAIGSAIRALSRLSGSVTVNINRAVRS